MSALSEVPPFGFAIFKISIQNDCPSYAAAVYLGFLFASVGQVISARRNSLFEGFLGSLLFYVRFYGQRLTYIVLLDVSYQDNM